MANLVHLAILKRGVKVWNNWRQKNFNIKPDLSRAILTEANLEGANFKEAKLDWTKFYKANLSSANFSGVDLQSADLRGANLKNANLEKADFRMKSLYGIDFRGANLKEADLTNAQFLETNLEGANLCKTNFSSVDFRNFSFQELNLTGAIFIKSDLSGASLRGSNLKSANFTDAKLVRADFCKASLENAIFKNADLIEANLSSSSCIGTEFINATLSGADFSKAVLSEADFRASFLLKADLSDSTMRGTNLGLANLTMANLRGADLTGACLFSTARDGWEIDGIKCEFIFWDNEWKKRTPENNIFQPGQFEDLYKQLPTIEFVFEQGLTPIDAFIMDRVVQAINERHPEFELKLDSFHSRGQPHAIFTVLHKEVAENALYQIKEAYEERFKVLEGKREQLLEVIQMLSSKPQNLQLIAKEIFCGGDKYETTGQSASVGPGAHAHDISFNQVWNQLSQDIDLPKLAEQLSELRQALKGEAKTIEQDTAVGEIAHAEAAAKNGDGPGVLKHLKKAGKWTFDVARDIGTDVAAEVIKKSIGF
jgi:uncharacterized protein YjbI with pentapeptide repeats